MAHRHLIYTRLGRRWRSMKGFRLNCHRFSVHRLHLRIYAILRFFGRYFKLIREGPRRRQRCDRSGSRRGLVVCDGQQELRWRACMRSNSFYADAIADCLDFIKRNSVSSVDEDVDGTLSGREVS